MNRLAMLIFLLACSTGASAATEILPLGYRMADEVLPIVSSVLGDEGRVSAYGNQLIVNAPPEKIEEIRALLAQLDTAPKRLLITVDSSESAGSDSSGYRVDGSARIGDVEVQAGRGERHGRDNVRIINRSTASRDGGFQQVHASEGRPALIQVGQSVPLTSTSVGPYGQVHNQVQYRNVTRGFYVTAQIMGDQVQVDISSNNDRLSQSHPGVIDVQSTDTRVRGRLGEWLPLGGLAESYQQSEGGFLRRHSTQGRQDLTMRLKVEVLD